jgi:hypothetical protein
MAQGGRMTDNLLQALMFVTGAVAIVLAAKPPPLARWGWLIGLLSQPLWLYSTYRAGQWGMFLVAIAYTYGWGEGAWREWGGKLPWGVRR